MNDGATPMTTTNLNSFWNKDFTTFNQQEYPNFDNSALLFSFSLTHHYFIPNDYILKGEYDLYIYAEDNAAEGIRKSSCT
jgi:hypothetical protein